ncbi:HEPN domain-containing protein [Bacillus thuringiensis]|uniref:ApeA N-terminal domain 1-containing protein n=1 Tax=Bacillus thuringiensis TaxID=1428 RepID=UPI0020C4BCED|nr:HEPN domain-containing protein [Bacillus thuringiensis]
MKTIKLAKQTMIDEFEVDGFWFVPNTPNYKVHGKLSFSPQDASLNLFGSLTQDPLGLYSKIDFDTIRGITESGEFVCLFNINRTSNKNNLSGFLSQTYKFEFMIVGGHFSSVKELMFQKVSFNSTYLESFISASAFTTNIKHDENHLLKGVSTSFEYPEIKKWDIPSIDSTFAISSNFQFNTSGNKKINMEYKALLELISNSSQNYSWFLKKIYNLLSLISLFTGKEQFLKDLSFKIEDTPEVRNNKFKVFFTQKEFKEEKDIDTNTSITFPDIENNLANYLDKWYLQYNELEPLYNLYINTKYHGIYEEWKFLNYTRILEGYHRLKFTDSTFCNPSDYNPIKDAIITYLEETITDDTLQDLKKNIQNSISYAYEYPFKKRLIDIANSIDDPIFKGIFKNKKDMKGFMNKVKETRNKMTHPQTEESNIFTDFKLYLANIRLSALINALILIDLGFPSDFIEHKLSYLYYNLGTAKRELNS